MELRKKCTNHREGTIVGIADWINEITHVQYNEELTGEQKDTKIRTLINEMRSFDITKIGNLYLTSGGRVVLDKGYGEYFNNSDKVLFTLEELKSGISKENFQKRLNFVISEDSAWEK